MSIQKTVVINRTMQAGAGISTNFDKSLFEKTTLPPIQALLELGLSVIIATCGDTNSRFGEAVDEDGMTLTGKAFQKAFPKEVSEGRLSILVIRDWGLNAGSVTALNEGLALARVQKFSFALSFSTEAAVRKDLITLAISLMEASASLSVVGFLRDRWQEKRQWQVPQNMCSLWRLEALAEIGDFSSECSGTGKTIAVPGREEVLLAGMEDFHAMLRMMALDKLNWTMVGQKKPVLWANNFEVGSQREKDFLDKVARQELVMAQWAREVFPNEEDTQRTIEVFFNQYT